MALHLILLSQFVLITIFYNNRVLGARTHTHTHTQPECVRSPSVRVFSRRSRRISSVSPTSQFLLLVDPYICIFYLWFPRRINVLCVRCVHPTSSAKPNPEPSTWILLLNVFSTKQYFYSVFYCKCWRNANHYLLPISAATHSLRWITLVKSNTIAIQPLAYIRRHPVVWHMTQVKYQLALLCLVPNYYNRIAYTRNRMRIHYIILSLLSQFYCSDYVTLLFGQGMSTAECNQVAIRLWHIFEIVLFKYSASVVQQ